MTPQGRAKHGAPFAPGNEFRLMRNRYLDLLRFLAIVRVVVYHVTGWATLTLVFPAMSVMFALAGSLMAASLQRTGPAAVVRRLRRLLPALWLVALIFVPAMLVFDLPVTWRLVYWIMPLGDPPANAWGAIALSVIWYLRDYLWFVLVSPLAWWLFRRWPVPTLVAPYLLLIVVELRFPTAPIVLRDFGLYFGAWLLGFAHHAGMLRRMSRRVLLPTAATLATLGAAWIFTHPGPRGYDLNDVRFGNALWSAAFILVALGLAPAGAAWVDRTAWFGRLVTLFNQRAVTIYLWHMPFVAVLTPLVGMVGWSHTDPLGLAVRIVLVFALVGIVALLFGWVEDVGAGRRPLLIPGWQPAAPGARLPAPRTPVRTPTRTPSDRTVDGDVAAVGVHGDDQRRRGVVGDPHVGVTRIAVGVDLVTARRNGEADVAAAGVGPYRSGLVQRQVDIAGPGVGADLRAPQAAPGDGAGTGTQRQRGRRAGHLDVPRAGLRPYVAGRVDQLDRAGADRVVHRAGAGEGRVARAVLAPDRHPFRGEDVEGDRALPSAVGVDEQLRAVDAVRGVGFGTAVPDGPVDLDPGHPCGTHDHVPRAGRDGDPGDADLLGVAEAELLLGRELTAGERDQHGGAGHGGDGDPACDGDPASGGDPGNGHCRTL